MSSLLWLLCLITLALTWVLLPHGALLAGVVLFIAAPVISWLILLLIRKKVAEVLAKKGNK